MYKKVFLVGFTFLLLIFISCAARKSQGLKSLSERKITSETSADSGGKPSWEIDWEDTLQKARKESIVVAMQSTTGQVREVINKNFKDKYGINPEIMVTSTGAGAVKILSERRAGLYTTDVLSFGSTTSIGLKDAGALEPIEPLLILPEVVDPKAWWKGQLDFIDKEHFILGYQATPSKHILISTDLVKLGEEPREWWDLLNAKWKGKIVMWDPSYSANTWFALVAYYLPQGIEFWKNLAKQEPVITRDARWQVESVAKGKYAMAIGYQQAPSAEFISVEAPIKELMLKGPVGISTGGRILTYVNKAPHPSAAKIYINWILTREAQTLISRALAIQSGRLDVPTDHLDSRNVRQPGVEYIETYHEDFARKTLESVKLAREIFGIR